MWWPETGSSIMPELTRAILVLACFVAIGSLLMLLIVRPGTGEFVISVAALAVGVGLGAVAIGLHAVTNRKSVTNRDVTKRRRVRPEEEK